MNESEMEEERRLMYVGVTRAKEKVYLLFTGERNIFGSTQINPPSRFINDIPEHLIEIEERKEESGLLSNGNSRKSFFRRSSKKVKMENITFISKNKLPESDGQAQSGEFKDGDRVEHKAFGSGLVISTQGDVLTIAFKQVGLKKLSASVAPLKKI